MSNGEKNPRKFHMNEWRKRDKERWREKKSAIKINHILKSHASDRI